ncbi:MAG: response regulator transcription factor [Candidatus Levybacteria bacterium]|nr:response regulator transcription factor [Candidatus Levybacteria bacterium]
MKILLIEDDRETAATLKEELKKDYIVEISFTGEEGEYQADINEYDLIMLDLGLPDKDGKEVCRNIRKKNLQLPILILTGEHDIYTKISLFDLGADDYLTKPFIIGELKARIRALLRRRHQVITSNLLSIDDLTVDLNKKIVQRGVKNISLRRKEYYLLEYLIRNTGRVVSRSMILDHVWESDSEALTNVVDVHIKYLRDKIDRPFGKQLIKTVHGLGYKFEA